MSGDWIKMKTGLEQSLKVFNIARSLGITKDAVIYNLYRSAAWFAEYGKYGKLKYESSLLDWYLEVDGFSDALASVGWLESHNGVLLLKGFCTVSATRKSLGRAVRERILGVGACAACGSPDELVIDHKTPIVRGGSCDESNLQALCAPCNRSKGRKTMEEFINDH